jgi:hypothetical protein
MSEHPPDALLDECDCGADRWAYRAVGERSKAGNAARLEAMAAESNVEKVARISLTTMDELHECQAELAAVFATLNASTLECDRLRDDRLAYREAYENAAAECERLRAIVDLACQLHEVRGIEMGSVDVEAAEAFDAAVAAEVKRRAGP